MINKTNIQIDFSINDLTDELHQDTKLKKLVEKSPNTARTILWLAIRFIKNESRSINSGDLNREVLMSSHTYSIEILNRLAALKLVSNHVIGIGKKRVYTMDEEQKKYLEELIPIAKKRLGLI